MAQNLEMVERTSGRTLLDNVRVADTFFTRLFGLMLHDELGPDEGMLFPRCSSIHMFFMSFSIDAVFLNTEKEVVKVVSSLKPWRISWCRAASSVLEGPANWAAENGVEMGMQVMLREPREN